MISIRKITPEHLDALCALEARLFDPESCPLSRKNFAYHIREENILLGAFEGEALAGYILLFIYRKSARIYSVAIDPAFQKKGIATRLIERVGEIARGMKKEHLTLEVRTDNLPARQLYTANGFYPVRKLPEYYPDGHDGIKMSLLLQ
jgi:ribosomal protein S18 acetylase RimI-like enzyme